MMFKREIFSALSYNRSNAILLHHGCFVLGHCQFIGTQFDFIDMEAFRVLVRFDLRFTKFEPTSSNMFGWRQKMKYL